MILALLLSLSCTESANEVRPTPNLTDSAVPVDSGASVDTADTAEAVPIPDEELIYIDGATFGMGCPSADDPRCAEQYEEVTVAAFWIDRYEARAVSYTACVDAGVCTPPFASVGKNIDISARYDIEDPTFPAVGISQTQAATYCQWRGLRLPTSMEWELAARGPTSTDDYPWGAAFDWAMCNGCDGAVPGESQEGDEPYEGCDGKKDGYAGPAPVDAFPGGASPYGVEQLCGNQFEWTSTEINPPEGKTTAYYIIRGGGWGPNNSVGSPEVGLVVWKRFWDPLDVDADHMGMRCAKDG